MGWLVRKVQKSKWNGPEWASVDKVPGDALTVDLKTSSNTLSFWVSSANEGDDLDRAVTAIAAGLDDIEAIDVVAVPGESFKGFVVKETPGRTAAKELRDTHRDVSDISADVLGAIARQLAEEIYAGRSKRYTRSALLRLLKACLDHGHLDTAALSEKVVADLGKMDATA